MILAVMLLSLYVVNTLRFAAPSYVFRPHVTFCSTLHFATLHCATSLYVLQHFTFCNFTLCHPTLRFAALYVLWSNNGCLFPDWHSCNRCGPVYFLHKPTVLQYTPSVFSTLTQWKLLWFTNFYYLVVSQNIPHIWLVDI